MNNLFTKNKSVASSGKRQEMLLQEFGHLWTRMDSGLDNLARSTRRIGFCAANPGEGTTSMAANYALFLGRHGKRVTLVETNMRRPSLAEHFDVKSSPGLWDILDGTVKVAEALQEQISPGVNLITAGKAPRDLLVGSENFNLSELFAELDEHNDLIVLDVPPLNSSPEANVILPQLDGVIFVVQANRSRACSVQRSVKSLEFMGAKVIGSVMNKVQYDMPSIIDRLL